MKTIDEITASFRDEFGPLADRFVITKIALNTAETAPFVPGAGVYVFWKDGSVIKVGRHLKDTKKRALEHIRDNSKSDKIQMSTLKGDSACQLILFTVKNDRDEHWAFALEDFFERNLVPLVRSDRRG